MAVLVSAMGHSSLERNRMEVRQVQRLRGRQGNNEKAQHGWRVAGGREGRRGRKTGARKDGLDQAPKHAQTVTVSRPRLECVEVQALEY